MPGSRASWRCASSERGASRQRRCGGAPSRCARSSSGSGRSRDGEALARVIAFIPDLLFGSAVVGALSAAGHEPVLVSNEDVLRSALSDAQALVVDLTFDVPQRIELVRSVRPAGLKTLAFYSHVEADVRDQGRA